jgi:6-pyruvoyltetrahydropterin/6-carboxytetrahydropterin synthase
MTKIRLTKEFMFEMAHALWNYDGSCKNMHGHSYKLFVTVTGTPVNDLLNPKNGMVIDFGILKSIVREEIIDQLDHAFMINKNAPYHDLQKISQMFDKMVLSDYQPTCENMLIDFAARLQNKLPQYVKLHNLRLQETVTSFAEWFASDNSD